MKRHQLKSLIKEVIKEMEEPPRPRDPEIDYRKAKKAGDIEGMAYYRSPRSTPTFASWDRFKGSWAYHQWLKKPETQKLIQQIKDEERQFSYLRENSNQYTQRKKILLNSAYKLTEQMKKTAKEEFGV